jgi:hypothetical protein
MARTRPASALGRLGRLPRPVGTVCDRDCDARSSLYWHSETRKYIWDSEVHTSMYAYVPGIPGIWHVQTVSIQNLSPKNQIFLQTLNHLEKNPVLLCPNSNVTVMEQTHKCLAGCLPGLRYFIPGIYLVYVHPGTWNVIMFDVIIMFVIYQKILVFLSYT